MSVIVQNCDVLYITTERISLIEAALRETEGRDIFLVVNLNELLLNILAFDPVLLRRTAARANVLLMNDAESTKALKMLGRGSWSRAWATSLAELVITAGTSGGRVSTAPFAVWHPYSALPTERPACPVGAGDTFNGTYLVARFLEGRSVQDSCLRAAEAASRKVELRRSSLMVG